MSCEIVQVRGSISKPGYWMIFRGHKLELKKLRNCVRVQHHWPCEGTGSPRDSGTQPLFRGGSGRERIQLHRMPSRIRASASTLREETTAILAPCRKCLSEINAGTYPVGSYFPPEYEPVQQLCHVPQTQFAPPSVCWSTWGWYPHAGIGTIIKARSASPRYVLEVASLSELFPRIDLTEQLLLSSKDVTADGSLSLILDLHPRAKPGCASRRCASCARSDCRWLTRRFTFRPFIEPLARGSTG